MYIYENSQQVQLWFSLAWNLSQCKIKFFKWAIVSEQIRTLQIRAQL